MLHRYSQFHISLATGGKFVEASLPSFDTVGSLI